MFHTCSTILLSQNKANRMKPAFLVLLTFNSIISCYCQTEVTYINQGFGKYNVQNFEGAIADYTKAIQINPANAETYFRRADAKRALQDYAGALADYNKTLEINSGYPEVYVKRAFIKQTLQDYHG